MFFNLEIMETERVKRRGCLSVNQQTVCKASGASLGIVRPNDPHHPILFPLFGVV